MAVKTLRNELGEYRGRSVGMLCSSSRVDRVAMIESICADLAERDRHVVRVFSRIVVAEFAGVGVDAADILAVSMVTAMPYVVAGRAVNRRVGMAGPAAYTCAVP